MMVSLTWCVLLCAISFLLGMMVEEIMDSRFEKALCENLMELQEIHEHLDKDGDDGND